MSALHRLYPGRKGSKGHNLYKEVVGVGVYAGAAYGFGYIQNRYRERATVKGVPVDLLAGVVLTGAAYFNVGGSGVSPLLRDVGRAGVGAFFHTLGAGKGAEQSGVTRLLINKGDVARAKAALPSATVLGEIPRAPHGDYLSAAELAELAR